MTADHVGRRREVGNRDSWWGRVLCEVTGHRWREIEPLVRSWRRECQRCGLHEHGALLTTACEA